MAALGGKPKNCVPQPQRRPLHPAHSPRRRFHTLPEGSSQAIPYFQAVLDNTAAEERLRLSARWLLNIAYMTLGQYPEEVPPAHQIPPEAFESQTAFPRWVNVAPALGLDTFSLSGGGRGPTTSTVTGISISSSRHRTWPDNCAFFRNGGDGTFADRTEEANLNGLLGGTQLGASRLR